MNSTLSQTKQLVMNIIHVWGFCYLFMYLIFFLFVSCQSTCTSTSVMPTETAEIISLISVNNHLQTTDHSRPPPETSTEKCITQAIKEGDFSTAEAMSDRLASLEVQYTTIRSVQISFALFTLQFYTSL